MRINDARNDKKAGAVFHSSGLAFERIADGGNASAFDGNVKNAVTAVERVNDAPVFE